MTNRVRGLAKKVSCFVVRAARSGSKEWARATARETEFIQNDWAALRWALGSMRILWRPVDAPITSLVDVPQSARKFAKEIRKRTVIGTLVCVYEIVYFLSVLHGMRNTIERAGCYL